MRSFKVTYMVVAFLATGSMPIAVAAQSDSSNQNVQELREQMNKLQARLGEFGEEQSDEGCHPPRQARPPIKRAQFKLPSLRSKVRPLNKWGRRRPRTRNFLRTPLPPRGLTTSR